MKIIATWALALSAGVPMAAEAATYTSSFSLDNVLPQLRVGDIDYDTRPEVLPGAWTTNGTQTAGALAQEQTGVAFNPLTGLSEPTWSRVEGGIDMRRTQATAYTMGTIHGKAYQLDNDAYGDAAVNDRSLGVYGTIEEGGGKFNGWASWSREFTVDAYSSFSFAVNGRVNVVDEAQPFDLQRGGTLDESHSFASAFLRDAFGRAGVELSATMGDLFGASLADVLSYSTTPEGRLTLTVTNNSANSLSGLFAAGARVDALLLAGPALAAPVPEPESIAMLIAGLGLVGAETRRRRARNTAPA